MHDLKFLRRQLRAKRRALDSNTQRQHSQRICAQLELQHSFKEASCIAAFLHFDGEVNLSPLIELSWQQGKTIALPILPTTNREPLSFAEYLPNSPTSLDRFNIISPDLTTANSIALCELDLVLTPLVGFDNSGTRIGMGAGFYDRTFADIRPTMIGVAHQCQQVDHLVRQPWDVPLNGIVTEQQFIDCSR